MPPAYVEAHTVSLETALSAAINITFLFALFTP